MNIKDVVMVPWTLLTAPKRWKNEIKQEVLEEWKDSKHGLGKYLKLPKNATFEEAKEIIKREGERVVRIAFKLPLTATKEDVFKAVSDEFAKSFGYSSAEEMNAKKEAEYKEGYAKWLVKNSEVKVSKLRIISSKIAASVMGKLYSGVSALAGNITKLEAETCGLPEYATHYETEIAHRAIEGVLAREYYGLSYDSTYEQLQKAIVDEYNSPSSSKS